MSKPITTGPASIVTAQGAPSFRAKQAADALLAYLRGEGFEIRTLPVFDPIPETEATDAPIDPVDQAGRTARLAISRDSSRAFASRLKLRTQGCDSQIYSLARVHYWSQKL